MENTRPSKAFTLIEMLVCMGVISVLTAITLPILSSAREQGRSKVCGASLHSYATAVNLYMNDDRGGNIPFVPNLNTFYDKIGDYMDMPPVPKADESGHYIRILPYACPSDRKEVNFDARKGISYYYTPLVTNNPNPHLKWYTNTSDIRDGQKAVMADADEKVHDGKRNRAFMDGRVVR